MFNQKSLWAIIIPVVFLICGFGFFRTRTQQKPVKTYKAVTPKPKIHETPEVNAEKANSSVQHEHDHDHPRDIVPRSHTTGPHPSNSAADWRNDNTFDITSPKSDPWKQTSPETEPTAAIDETYPPRDWHKTKDPELFAEYFYAQLLKQFGNIPEVHIVGQHQLNMAKNRPISIDEYIKYLEASYTLWPHEKTSKLLEDLQKDKAEGVEWVFK